MWTNTPRLIQSQLEQRFWWALPRSAHAVHFSSVSRLSSPSGLHCERLRCPDHISDHSLPRSKAKGGALKGSGRNAGSGALVRVMFPDKSIGNIDDEERESMRRNWPGAHDRELDSRILNLRILYDWPALKSVMHICPGSSADTFKLNDLFNLLDMHGPLGFGVRAPDPPEQGGEQFFDARRLIGATNALRVAGVTTISEFFQPDHNFLDATQNSLSRLPSGGRVRLARTASRAAV